MKRSKYAIIGVVIAVAAALLFFVIRSHKIGWDETCNERFFINTTTINVCIADTVEERSTGLSGTPWLSKGKGMLFVFDTPGQYGFWMKDMKYALDILWLNENYEEVYRASNVTPDTYPTVITPPVTAKYVLETNPGEIPE